MRDGEELLDVHRRIDLHHGQPFDLLEQFHLIRCLVCAPRSSEEFELEVLQAAVAELCRYVLADNL